MAKARIGHFAEAQVLEALEVDYIDESEVLTPADEANHIDKWAFKILQKEEQRSRAASTTRSIACCCCLLSTIRSSLSSPRSGSDGARSGDACSQA